MKYHALFVIFEKAAKFEIRLLQIIGGALRIKQNKVIHPVILSLEIHPIIFGDYRYWQTPNAHKTSSDGLLVYSSMLISLC